MIISTIAGLLIILVLILVDIALLFYRFKLRLKKQEEGRRLFELRQQELEAKAMADQSKLQVGRQEFMDSINRMQQEIEKLDAEFKS